VSRLQYYRRIFPAYLGLGQSQLSFWHETPEVNPNTDMNSLGGYYMPFVKKAEYAGPIDDSGIPLLDYRGSLGQQYNPIAIAQWGLGNYNLSLRRESEIYKARALSAADWLCDRLQQNSRGISVWNHHFDWEYRTRLKAPWFSALAQGQGISLLVRVHRKTGAERYLETAANAFEAFLNDVTQGGVTFTDANDDIWFEEYIVDPPTHILNGFIWAAWGVRDYFLATGEDRARKLFDGAIRTLTRNLDRYDLGFWSLYEQSGTLLPMVASPFYHRLHIVQLKILHKMTGQDVFAQVSERWDGYTKSPVKKTRALCCKSAFKLCYY
jgi:hypothetical protein